MNAKIQLVRSAKGKGVDLERLARMRCDELLPLYRKMFGHDLASGNSEQARRRIAWQLQAEREGGLPESARQHALAIARAGVLRSRVASGARSVAVAHSALAKLGAGHDSRLPMPGSVIVKEYHGRTILVRALDDGFEYDGHRYSSLSAIAKQITGKKWNGFVFFGLSGGSARGR